MLSGARKRRETEITKKKVNVTIHFFLAVKELDNSHANVNRPD